MKKILLMLLLSGYYSLIQTGIDQIDKELAEACVAQEFSHEQILNLLRRAYEKQYSEMSFDELKKEVDKLSEKLLKMDPAEFQSSMLIQSEVLLSEIRKKTSITSSSHFPVFPEDE